MDDELLDLVNRDDEVIGTVNRRDYDELLASGAGYIRSCDMFIVNSRGQVYVPVRTAHKTIAPNGFDFSVGGHVGAGETYEEALLREAEEELNLHLSAEELHLVAKTVQDDIRYIQSLYLVRSNDTPTFNPDDVASASWMTIEEFTAALQSGHPAKGSLKRSLKLLSDYLS